MDLFNYRGIKAKLKKKGILFKDPDPEDASNQLYSLARQLDDQKLYPGFCHLAMTTCQTLKSTNQVGAFLNAARTFSQAKHEVVSLEDQIRLVVWIYTEALLICDRSFIRPIRLELGRFYENHKMYQEAAECFKQSMSISRCVTNLILAEKYKSALDELKNCPSHLMTAKDHTSMFLLELLLNEEADDERERNSSLQHLSNNSQISTKNRGLLAIDDSLCDLIGLLESLLILQKQPDKTLSAQQQGDCAKDEKIKKLVVDKLSAFLDSAQKELLYKMS